MPLIKSAIATTTVRLSLRDIEADARALIERAENDAEQIVSEARRRAAEIGAQAMQEGWKQGHAQGLAEARAQAVEQFAEDIALSVEAMARAAAMIKASRVQRESAALADMVKLTLAIARRVTKRQGLIDPSVLTENLREAVRQLIRHEDVRVTIHPSQRATLIEALALLRQEWPTLEHVEIVEDDSICPGGCRVSGGQGEIDATLQAQLDRLAVKLMPQQSAADGNGSATL